MPTTQNEKRAICIGVEKTLYQGGIFNPSSSSSTEASRWRTSPDPFWLSSEEWTFLKQLGPYLLSFYKALNQLYFKSIRGIQPQWCAAYLDQGKPETLIGYGRIKRFKQHLPLVIRPDLIPTESGMVAMELDSVPGGIGITACLSKAYADHAFSVIGGGSGMLKGFADVFHSLNKKETPTLAIVISEESKDYRPEMKWMGGHLESFGLKTYVVEPKEIQFSEEGLWIDQGSGPISVDFCYRFFELFDLMNVSKSELMLYSAKKGKVFLTPPIKAFLEEKMAFALLHHPHLTKFWEQEMGEEAFYRVKALLPLTWVLDPKDLPPYGMIPDLTLGARPVHHWLELSQASGGDGIGLCPRRNGYYRLPFKGLCRSCLFCHWRRLRDVKGLC